MKKINLILGIAFLLTSTLAKAESISCLGGYKTPSANDLMVSVSAATVANLSYTTIKDPVSGAESRDYTKAGANLVVEIEKLDSTLDALYSADASERERAIAARNFSVQLTVLGMSMLKQSEAIVSKDICEGGNHQVKAMGYIKLSNKLTSLQQTLAVASKFLHAGHAGSMTGVVGRQALSAPSNSEIAVLNRESLLRIRQYYYVVFKSMELGYIAEQPTESLARLKMLRAMPQIAPQRDRLIAAFLESEKEFNDHPLDQTIKLVLRDLTE